MDKERRQSTISTDDDVLSISKIGLPWAEEKCETLVNTIQTGFLRWCQIALEIGVEKIEGSATKYVEEINNVCLRLLSDMETHKSEVLEDMEELLKKLEVLCKRLHVKMPKVGDQKTLIESWNELDSKVKQFEEHIKIREKEVHSLRSKQLELCKSLGKTPKILKDNPLPTTAEIEEFQAYLEKLEEEKFARAEQFLAIKEEIINMAAELEMVPLSDFEKLVISGSDNDFPLTTSNLKELRSLHTSLTQKLQNIKDEVADLRLKINDLWDKLEIDIMEREEFLSGHVGHSVEVLEALKGEFKRCEEIKKANIKVFIDKLRDELTKLWDQCHCSLPQRRDQFLDSDCFNEDLLQLHEIAVEKWKLYYNENKELINLLEKHNLLWKKMLELDRSATNADRYKNRGGKLLKEEKERNKLSKLIPKIEDEIITLATEFQQRHNGKTFTTFGRTVEEYISDLHSNRENDLKIKLSARKQQREQVLTPAKSKCNLFPSISTSNLATPVPLSATKRKVLATPNSVIVNKKAKLVPESATKSQKKIPSIKITRVSADRKRRISKRRQRRSSQSLSNDRLEQIPSANDTAGTEYHDFQNDLTSKNNDCRSTILPEQVTSTAKAPFRPKYTPTKPARTPISFRGTPKTPKSPRANGTQLSTCRSNIRLIF